jgi:hypothetical protein
LRRGQASLRLCARRGGVASKNSCELIGNIVIENNTQIIKKINFYRRETKVKTKTISDFKSQSSLFSFFHGRSKDVDFEILAKFPGTGSLSDITPPLSKLFSHVPCEDRERESKIQ